MPNINSNIHMKTKSLNLQKSQQEVPLSNNRHFKFKSKQLYLINNEFSPIIQQNQIVKIIRVKSLKNEPIYENNNNNKLHLSDSVKMIKRILIYPVNKK